MKPRSGRRFHRCLLLVLCACGPAVAAIELPQPDGGTLSLESPASTLITLAPGVTELVYAAGAGQRIVATVEFSDYPEAAARLPRIGDAFRFDLERILALQPDLVIAWDSGNPSQAVQRLESLGLKVWRTELRKPSDIAQLLRLIARATGLADNGTADKVDTRLATLAKTYADQPPVRYFYQVAERPLFTLNGEHIVSQGISLCGGVNVFADETVLAPQVSREAVIHADPDVLIAPRLDGQDDPLAQWRDWPRMTAVGNGALVYLPADKISRATPRMLDSLEAGCKLLDRARQHPSKQAEEA